MKNKNLIVLIALTTMATSSSALIDISGNYEGTFTNGGPATYAQDLDLKMVGSVDDTTVTVLFEDLTGGSTVTANQLFIETSIEGLDFKGGNYKTQNGFGILQAESAVTNQMELGLSVAGTGINLGQVSGDGHVTIDSSIRIAGIDIEVQDVSSSTRFISTVSNYFGVRVKTETQETAIGRNTGVTMKTTLGEQNVMGVTGVYIDVNDATVVTQNDGIFGDISDAVNGKAVIGGVVEVNSTMGRVTGAMWEKNDLNNYKVDLNRNVMNYSYEKNESTDGVFAAKLNVAF